MDISACIDHLGLNANSYQLDQSPPPHELIGWREDNPDPQPTQEELEAAWEEIKDDIKWGSARQKRDLLLRNSDHVILSDAPYSRSKKTSWKTYRQELRDIPQAYSNVQDIVWPEPPEV